MKIIDEFEKNTNNVFSILWKYYTILVLLQFVSLVLSQFEFLFEALHPTRHTVGTVSSPVESDQSWMNQINQSWVDLRLEYVGLDTLFYGRSLYRRYSTCKIVPVRTPYHYHWESELASREAYTTMQPSLKCSLNAPCCMPGWLLTVNVKYPYTIFWQLTMSFLASNLFFQPDVKGNGGSCSVDTCWNDSNFSKTVMWTIKLSNLRINSVFLCWLNIAGELVFLLASNQFCWTKKWEKMLNHVSLLTFDGGEVAPLTLVEIWTFEMDGDSEWQKISRKQFMQSTCFCKHSVLSSVSKKAELARMKSLFPFHQQLANSFSSKYHWKQMTNLQICDMNSLVMWLNRKTTICSLWWNTQANTSGLCTWPTWETEKNSRS